MEPRFTKSQLEEIRAHIADVDGIDAKALTDQQLEALALAYLISESKEGTGSDEEEGDEI